MGAGLIYALIVVIWAVVLAPTWIRRSDRRLDPLFAARSSPSMRVLRRRSSAHGVPPAHLRPSAPPSTPRALRYGFGRRVRVTPVARPHLGGVGRVDQRLTVARHGGEPARVEVGPQPARRPRPTTRRRPDLTGRRRFVVTMLVGTVGLAVAVPVSGVPAWAPLVPLASFVGYLLYVRGEARRAYERKRRERLVTRRQAEARRRAELIAAEMPSLPERERPTMRIQPDGSWEPIKVPLPTYVTAPVARGRSGRPITLGLAGAWTRRRMPDLMRQSRRMPGRSLIGDQANNAAPSPQPRAANE